MSSASESRVGAPRPAVPVSRSPAACVQAAASRDPTTSSPVVVLRNTQDLRSFEAYLFGERDRPVVALARLRSGGPVVAPEEVRAIVGPRCAIYLIKGEHLLRRLGEILGAKLTVRLGQARVWWPGLTTRSDPADHPVVQPVEGDGPLEVLAEFARTFDLSRPHVRAEIRLVEDARAVLEHELAQAQQQAQDLAERLRGAQADRYQAERHAQAVGVKLNAALEQLAAAGQGRRLEGQGLPPEQ